MELTITEEGLRIELLESARGMFFESEGLSRPMPQRGSDGARQRNRELPNRVLIEGHTDSTPYSGPEYSNWELSSDRANQARRAMESNGLTSNQVGQVRGYADQDLHDKQTPTDPTNRRVSVIVKYRDEQPTLKLLWLHLWGR